MSAILSLLAGTARIDTGSDAYLSYQAGLLLSARLKAAVWIVRDHPDSDLRTVLRDIRKTVGKRSDARARGFGAWCSRIEPSVHGDDLKALGRQSRSPLIQAEILVAAVIPRLEAEDLLAQEQAVAALALHRASD